MLTLGIDSSTQGTKAVVLDAGTGRVVASASVGYGRDLPEFGSPDGFLPNADPRVRRAAPGMWLRGLDLALERLRDSGAPMGEIEAVGGDAQQHATVYLAADGSFSRAESPIWMDSSTSAEVAALDARFGGALRERTGSPAIERFAAAQAMKFSREDPEGWARTARVHLLSSFLTSYLAGEDAPVDVGDGAGMNLLNLKTLEWDAEICEFAAPGLLAKLPRVARPGDAPLRLAARFAQYGLRPGIPVAPFTGDNPASLVGCGAEEPGCAVISLGTSDTFFAAMRDFRTDPDGFGHVFGNPAGGFMSLSCFKNGSLARERVKDECGVDWKFFDETAFDLTPPGNGGRRAFPYFEPEITPRHDATGIEANFDWASAPSETRIRAVVEGQIANMRERTRWIGDFSKVFVTGGASRSRGIRGVIESIFGAKAQTLEVADSAAVGGARLAAKCLRAVALVCGLSLALPAVAADAGWKPAGELHVASAKTMQPQLTTVAAKANFPMLPLIPPQVMTQLPGVKKFGVPVEDAEFGARLFVRADASECQWVEAWPLPAGGVEAWKAAHPKKKVVNGVVTWSHRASSGPLGRKEPWKEYAAFTADGRWAYLSEDAELVKAAAASGAPFKAPLARGLMSLTLERAALDAAAEVAPTMIDDFLEAQKTAAEQLGAAGKDKLDDAELKAAADEARKYMPFLQAFERSVERARIVLGVSEHGLDVRMKLEPRKGSALDGPSRALPAEAMKFTGAPEACGFALVCAPFDLGGELGRLGGELLGDTDTSNLKKLIAKKGEKSDKEKAALEEELEVAEFFAWGTAAFFGSKATCRFISFSAAESHDGNAKSMRFAAHGVEGGAKIDMAAKPPMKRVVGRAKNEGGMFELVAERGGFKAGKAGAAGEDFARGIPEWRQAKAPLLAARFRMGVALDEEKKNVQELSLMLLGWRDGDAYRTLLRFPMEDIAKALSAAMAAAFGAPEDE